ncbi:hypothetical protein DEO72_LG10g2903 [Vigna unguiculata]|uniref:Uncharacterized protein n=1 Tax=Vigna unguiculata TaxID=3917 RepID=A0A4D6NIA6_VIGUN|nr:hypothetical protein DEO72_LG10g2903 [Vigna unguiculata]
MAAATTIIRIHKMGRPDRKSQNQKSKVMKIRNLGYKSGERNQNENYEQTCLGCSRGGRNRPPIVRQLEKEEGRS